MANFVEIHVPGGATERHELLEESGSIGAKAGSLCAFPPSSALGEQAIDLKVGSDAVVVEATSGTSDLVFRGQGLRCAVVPWGDEIYLGNVRLTFLLDSAGPNALAWLALPLAVIAFAFCALKLSEPADELSRELEPSPLFSKASGCSEREPAAAERRGHEARRLAQLKEERSPFGLADGLAAVNLLEEAGSCYELAGLPRDAAVVGADFERSKSRVSETYSSLRLQLRVALDHKRPRDALHAVRQLRTLLGSAGRSPYADWLETLQRELERKVALQGQ